MAGDLANRLSYRQRIGRTRLVPVQIEMRLCLAEYYQLRSMRRQRRERTLNRMSTSFWGIEEVQLTVDG